MSSSAPWSDPAFSAAEARLTDEARRATVDRRWRYRKLQTFNHFWRRQPLEEALFLPLLGYSLLATVIECRLMGWRSEEVLLLFARLPGRGLLFLLGLLGGVAVASGLAAYWTVRRGQSSQRENRVLLVLLAGMPGLGPVPALAFWRTRLGGDRPAAEGEVPPALTSLRDSDLGLGQRIRHWLGALDRGPGSAALVLPWLTFASFAVVVLLAATIAARRDISSYEPVLIAAAILLQLLGCVLSLSQRPREPVGDTTLLWLWRALLWLLPFVGPFLAAVFVGAWETRSRHPQSLASAAFSSRTSMSGLPLWDGLQHFLLERASGWGMRFRRWQQGRGSTRDATEVVARSHRVARAKLGCLLLDGLMVGWCAAHLMKIVLGENANITPLPLLLLPLLLLSVAGPLFSALVAVVVGSATAEPERERMPWSWPFFAALDACVGVVSGLALGSGLQQEFGACWFWGLGFGLLFAAFGTILLIPFHLSSRRRGDAGHYWMMKYGLLVPVSIPWTVGVSIVEIFFPSFPLLPLMSVLVVFLLGRWGVERLLHPFTLNDIRAKELPLWVRGTLAFLAVSLLVPLGGLLVPLWPALRSRVNESAGAARRRRWVEEARRG